MLSAAPGTVVVVGAGAAGLIAAIAAASAGARVVLLERTTDGGRKILISGGGRCNILPSVIAPDRFVTDSPAHLMRRMLKAWPLREQRAFFEETVGIPLALEEASGKWFPRSNRARDVRDRLVMLARQHGVRVAFNTSVTGLTPVEAGWKIEATGGAFESTGVVLATGGLSVPATGSDGAGLRLATALGHRLVPTYPALTPLLTDRPGHADLAGVSLNVLLRSRVDGRAIETGGGFLFTHRGYSGPAVLDISHAATKPSRSTPSAAPAVRTAVSASTVPSAMVGASTKRVVGSVSSAAMIRVQWSPLDAAAWALEISAAAGLVSAVLDRRLPARLAGQLMIEAGVPETRRVSELRRRERTALVEHLTAYALPWSGHEGYRKAEVTGGGVALDEVDPLTLESRRHPGLFLCGELLDAFGPIGGHNFAWAWATGRAAGRGAARHAAAAKVGAPVD